jgi:hypothetical protein
MADFVDLSHLKVEFGRVWFIRRKFFLEILPLRNGKTISHGLDITAPMAGRGNPGAPD